MNSSMDTENNEIHESSSDSDAEDNYPTDLKHLASSLQSSDEELEKDTSHAVSEDDDVRGTGNLEHEEPSQHFVTAKDKCSSQGKTFSLKHCTFVIDSKLSTEDLNKLMSKSQSSSDESDDEYTPIKEKKKDFHKQRYKLSSRLQDGLDPTKIYTNSKTCQARYSTAPQSALASETGEKLMKSSVLTEGVEQKHDLPPYQQSLRAARKKRQMERANSKGKNWFDMKAPEMTEDQKNDLTVLQMRHVLDPKAFYKHNDLKVLPKFFQMGKVVEHAADFYNSRIPKKQRKQNLVDELLADAEFRKFNKRKYTEAMQANSKHHSRVKLPKRMKKKKR